MLRQGEGEGAIIHATGEWRWARLLLGVALLLGAGLRLAFVLHGQELGGSQPMLDEGNYLGSALPLAQGQGIPDRWLWERPPLYILFAAGNFVLFGKNGSGNLLALGLLQTLIGLFSIWLIWRIGRLLFSDRPLAAGFAALLFAIAPAPAFYANMYMSETLYIALLLVWFYAILRWLLLRPAVEGGLASPDATASVSRGAFFSFINRYFVIAAVAFAGAALTRSLLLYFLPLLVGWLIWQGREHWRRMAGQAAVFVAIVLLLILPWTVRNVMHYGRFILIDTTGQINLYIDNGPLTRTQAYARLNQIANVGDRADFAQREAVATILADPGRMVGAAAARLRQTWRADLFTEFQSFLATKYPSSTGTAELTYALAGGFYHLLFFTLAILGLALARGETAAKWLALLLAALHTLTTLLAHPEYRYVIPFFAVFAPWAGWALAAVFAPRRWRVASRQTGWLRWGLAAVGVAWLLYSSAPVLGGYVSGSRAAYHLGRATLANIFGDVAGEAGQIEAALDDFDAANLRTRLGDIRRQQADIVTATALYQQAAESDPHYWPAALELGAARRQQGDIKGAEAAFSKIEPSFRAKAQQWGFEHLWDVRPLVDIGQADYGYVRGCFEPEREGARSYRWSTDMAAVRLYTATQATTITLTLRASSPGQHLHLSINGQAVGDYQPSLEWQNVVLDVPPALRDAHNYAVQISVDAKAASTQDPRALGVALDQAAVH